MTKENTRKTSEKKVRIFGRIDEETWKRWKKSPLKPKATSSSTAARNSTTSPASTNVTTGCTR